MSYLSRKCCQFQCIIYTLDKYYRPTLDPIEHNLTSECHILVILPRLKLSNLVKVGPTHGF